MSDWIEIESAMERIEETVEEVLCRINSSTLSNERLFGLRLALHEAIGNAIIHGNHRQPGRSVCIRHRRVKNRIEVTVRDQGEGFDPATVPDPTCTENLCLPSGRGIFLMKKLVDEVRFSEKGNEVTLAVDLA